MTACWLMYFRAGQGTACQRETLAPSLSHTHTFFVWFFFQIDNAVCKVHEHHPVAAASQSTGTQEKVLRIPLADK